MLLQWIGAERSGSRNSACRCKSADNSGTHFRNDQDSVARFGEDVKAELIGSSDVIAISVCESDAAIALDVVKAVTAQYLLSLRDYEQVGNGRHRLLMPATLLEEPVSLKPIYAAFIGAIVGIAIGILGIMLRRRLGG